MGCRRRCGFFVLCKSERVGDIPTPKPSPLPPLWLQHHSCACPPQPRTSGPLHVAPEGHQRQEPALTCGSSERPLPWVHRGGRRGPGQPRSPTPQHLPLPPSSSPSHGPSPDPPSDLGLGVSASSWTDRPTAFPLLHTHLGLKRVETGTDSKTVFLHSKLRLLSELPVSDCRGGGSPAAPLCAGEGRAGLISVYHSSLASCL